MLPTANPENLNPKKSIHRKHIDVLNSEERKISFIHAGFVHFDDSYLGKIVIYNIATISQIIQIINLVQVSG